MTLEPTGERLVPDAQWGELVHAEHLARYRWACQFARGRRVLDVACGEGYGTALLAAADAAEAVGADIDAATVAHAAAKYAPARFVEASLERLPFEDDSFDLVVSFETIEHVADSDAALAELRRVLVRDGTLLISTPNAARYLVDNEFHTREFTAAEFATLLATRFDDVELLQQQNWLASMVLGSAQAPVADGKTRLELDLYKLAGIEPGGELYTVAICGPRPPVPPRDVAVAGDVHEAHELAQRVLGADRTAREWRARAGTAERNLAEWERRATEAERQQSAWEERAAEAERVQQAWQERATEAERQADELRARLAEVDDRLAAIETSSAWKLTKPLRVLAGRQRPGRD